MLGPPADNSRPSVVDATWEPTFQELRPLAVQVMLGDHTQQSVSFVDYGHAANVVLAHHTGHVADSRLSCHCDGWTRHNFADIQDPLSLWFSLTQTATACGDAGR